MKNQMIIYYTPFAAQSPVWLIKDGKQECQYVSSALDTLSSCVTGLAYAENAFQVSISAPPAIIDEITQMVMTEEQKNYSNNKIVIEGI